MALWSCRWVWGISEGCLQDPPKLWYLQSTIKVKSTMMCKNMQRLKVTENFAYARQPGKFIGCNLFSPKGKGSRNETSWKEGQALGFSQDYDGRTVVCDLMLSTWTPACRTFIIQNSMPVSSVLFSPVKRIKIALRWIFLLLLFYLKVNTFPFLEGKKRKKITRLWFVPRRWKAVYHKVCLKACKLSFFHPY